MSITFIANTNPLNMKILNLSVGSMIWRLHIMSALVVVLGFLGYMYVGIVLGVILFLVTLMGVPLRKLNPFTHLPKGKDYDWHHRHHPVHH